MTDEQHILFGRHSNIPECCIEHFVSRVDYGAAKRRNGANYAMCETCLNSDIEPVKIHRCTEACAEHFRDVIGFSEERIAEMFRFKAQVTARMLDQIGQNH